MRRTLKRIAAALPELIYDGIGLAGAGCVVYGIAEISMPAAWIVGGIGLIGAAVLLVRSA